MAAALPFVMAGLSVVQGIQGYQQNQAMAKATQRQSDANIQNEKNTLAIKQKQLQRTQELAAGKATVAASGSGATLGSFDTLFADNENQALMDKYMQDYDSKMTQENIRYNAAVKKQEYKSAATSSLIKGITGAASTFASSPMGSSALTSASNSAGQSVGSAFSSSATGPYLNYGSRTLSGY